MLPRLLTVNFRQEPQKPPSEILNSDVYNIHPGNEKEQ